VLLGAVLLFASASNAGVIQSDFDPGGTYYGGTEGWFPYGAAGMGTITNPTGGTTTWADIHSTNQYYTSVTSQDWATPDVTTATWNDNSNLEFDVILPASWLPTSSATVTVEFQTNTGGSGAINKYGSATILGSLKDTVQHVNIDYSSLKPFAPTPNWNLSFEVHPGYDYGWDTGGNPSAVPADFHYYLDNVQFTPEPNSFGVMAFSGLLAGLCRKSRRT
jgi:hypothetical protein